MDATSTVNPTIAAPITAYGMAAVSVVRVSGELTRQVINKVCVHAERILKSPREMVYTPILNCASKNTLDYALVCFFAAPNSYTGEDCAEFCLHGSTFVVSQFLSILSSLGVQMAAAGEFSQRAFLNGKLDLSQAEAVSDLVAAESKMQAEVALSQLEGKLTGALMSLGEPLRDVLAEIEAYIDFPEEDVGDGSRQKWNDSICVVISSLEKYISSYEFGRICRQGAKVAIVGLPNAGKSSLLNSLLGESRVIVSPIAGTTRDSVEERISLDGLNVCLSDTAGLAHEDGLGRKPDEIERMGIELSWKRIKDADVVVYVTDVSVDRASLEQALIDRALIDKVIAESKRVIGVGNKADLVLDSQSILSLGEALGFKEPLIFVSAKTGEGLLGLKGVIRRVLISDSCSSDKLLITTERHVNALKKAKEALSSSSSIIINSRMPLEIVSVEIRSALSFLDEIVGVTCSEDVLRRIFERFCIGK